MSRYFSCDSGENSYIPVLGVFMKNKRQNNVKKQITLHMPRQVLKYLSVFAAALTILILTFVRFEQVYAVYFLKPVAQAGYFILKLLGLPVTFTSESLSFGYCDYVLPHQVLQVNFGCTGIYVLFIYIAAVIGYPSTVANKLAGLGIGIPLFLLYSVVRLVVMGIVGHWFTGYLSFVHNYLMVVINIAFVLWLYAYWIEHVARKDKK
ncbi:hypothetical protein ACFL6I_14185 [candidate division KSB1 bacterium]